jgi:hypothetical protein
MWITVYPLGIDPCLYPSHVNHCLFLVRRSLPIPHMWKLSIHHINHCLSLGHRSLPIRQIWIPVSQHMWIMAYLSLTIPCCLSPTGKCPLFLQYQSLPIHHKWIPVYPSPDPFLPLKCDSRYLSHNHSIHEMGTSACTSCESHPTHPQIPVYPSMWIPVFTRSIITVHPSHVNLC